MNLDERSDALDKEMAKHPAEESIQILLKDARRRKQQVRLLTVSVIFDIFLSIGLAWFAYQANRTAELAQSNKDAVIANCEVSNESRKNNRELWAFAFSFPPDPPRTDIENQRVEQFKAYIAKTFVERNCHAEINKL